MLLNELNKYNNNIFQRLAISDIYYSSKNININKEQFEKYFNILSNRGD